MGIAIIRKTAPDRQRYPACVFGCVSNILKLIMTSHMEKGWKKDDKVDDNQRKKEEDFSILF